jgi:hypothetical protein
MIRVAQWLALAVFFAFAFSAAEAAAQGFPASLKGQIIANAKPIDVPTAQKNFGAVLKKQDRKNFKKDEEGKYTIHFVAFFSKPAPVDTIGVVVLDEKKEAIAVAEVPNQKGQVSLSSMIVVESTETPKKKHVLQVFYASGKKPVVLAKKELILK